jgi:hypothetical protein
MQMNANGCKWRQMNTNQENLLASIRVHSRLITFAVDYRRDNYNGLGARMF